MISQLIRNKRDFSQHNIQQREKPTTHKFISQIHNVNIIKYSAIKRNKAIINPTTCLNFENLYMIADFIHNGNHL